MSNISTSYPLIPATAISSTFVSVLNAVNFPSAVDTDLAKHSTSRLPSGVRGTGGASLFLRRGTAIAATIDIQVWSVLNGVEYLYSTIAQFEASGDSADIVIPISIPLSEGIAIKIKSSVDFLATTGDLLFL